MLLIERKAILKWNSANKKRYVDFGYQYTKMGEEFLVDIEHLTPTTRAIVSVQCDFCDGKFEDNFKNYNQKKRESICEKDTCEGCISKKRIEGNLIKYGVNNPLKSEEVKNKVKETMLEKYGVESPMHVEEFKEKQKESLLLKYGVTNPMKSEIIKEKAKETNNEKYGADYHTQTIEHWNKVRKTNLSKYGVENVGQSKEFREKARMTNIERYGFPVPIQNIEIHKKIVKTLFENKTAPISNQQMHIHELIGGELNYPIGNINADICFPSEKIVIEYDGGGHWLSVAHGNVTMEEFNKKEQRRNYFLYKRDWKIIRIISRKDKFPSDGEIVSFINKAKQYLKDGHHWIELDIDEGKIKCSQYENDIKFNSLRPLKKLN